MKNYIFGYARVSTEQQNLDRQMDALQKYGVDMIFNEKMTGTKAKIDQTICNQDIGRHKNNYAQPSFQKETILVQAS